MIRISNIRVTPIATLQEAAKTSLLVQIEGIWWHKLHDAAQERRERKLNIEQNKTMTFYALTTW